MTDDRLPLAELMAKTGDGDFLCTVAESVLQIIMEADVDGLIGAVLLEQNDEYQLQCRYMQLEGMTALATLQIEEVSTLQITPKAA